MTDSPEGLGYPAAPSSHTAPTFPPAAIVPNHYVEPDHKPAAIAPSGYVPAAAAPAQFAPYVPHGEAGVEQSYSTLPPSNLAVGIAAGFGLGLLAALAYAGAAIITEREFLAAGLLIGFAVAFGFHKFGHTRGIVPGLIAAIITLVLFGLAIFVEGAGTLAKMFDVSFVDAMRAIIENAGEFLKGYFSTFMSYVFVIVSVGAAFFYAYDRKSQRFDRRHGH